METSSIAHDQFSPGPCNTGKPTDPSRSSVTLLALPAMPTPKLPKTMEKTHSTSNSIGGLGSKVKSGFRNMVHTIRHGPSSAPHTADAPTSPTLTAPKSGSSPAKLAGKKYGRAVRKIARMLHLHQSKTPTDTPSSQQPTADATQSRPPNALPRTAEEAFERLNARWGPVLDIPDESIIELALNLASKSSSIPKEVLADGSDIKVVATMSGCNNRVFVVQYGEDLKVCVRVPACGWEGKWTGKDVQAFRTQVLTMKYIRKHTDCSIAEVIAYDTTFDNAIHAPHMVMTYLEGRTVASLWFEEEGPLPLEEKRQNILRSLAHQAAQLRSLTFDKIGALHFSSNDDDKPEVGPFHMLNFGVSRTSSFLQYVDDEVDVEPKTSSDAWLRGQLEEWKKHVTEPSEENPFPEADRLQFWEHLGIYRLFSMALDELPLRKDGDGEQFVITPPDFDWQNILADDHGNVTALVDWDRVDTAPGFVGCCAFPDFLSEDWQPTGWYSWPHWAENTMSPMQYDRYRVDYNRYMVEACGGEGDCKYTAMSHLYSQLSRAVGRTEPQKKLLERIITLAVPRVNFESMCQCIGDKGLTSEQEKCIREELKKVLA